MKVNQHIDYHQKTKHYHKIVAKLIGKYIERKDGSILDIGCGVGHTLVEVRGALPYARLSAADVDKNCLELTESKVDLDDYFLIKNIEEIIKSTKHGRYDAIIMSHVLEHLQQPADVIEKMIDMLRFKGILVLAVPNPVRPDVFLSAIRKKHYVNKGHAYAWDRSHWINFLENILKLNVIAYSQDFVPLPFFRRFSYFKKLEPKLSEVFPWLSFSNIAVIRKNN